MSKVLTFLSFGRSETCLNFPSKPVEASRPFQRSDPSTANFPSPAPLVVSLLYSPPNRCSASSSASTSAEETIPSSDEND
ncbi:unnamed protein product [Pseudo-nitzschia multistriata]|uniref:Uncharacterized protein n=1 Tax=Pseudo-nitzschia multistriata TaxID=183589 RepID=A0A448YUV2_9STRA|nr:unnamed protein product [Pseudo-nitzschia multistriata]